MRINHGPYRLGYRPDIEGLRAIAILLVVGAHAGFPWLGGGFVGVDVFFVLSGFLITGLLVREITSSGSLNVVDFYIRRLRRLLPALITMLVGSVLLAALLLSPVQQHAQASAGVSAAMWWSNIHFALGRFDYFSPSTETNIFLHTWSLGVEEQFYLVWPALMFVVLRASRKNGSRKLSVAMLLLIAASFIACAVATYRAPLLAFYMMPLRAWQFAVGAWTWLQCQGRSSETDQGGPRHPPGVMLVLGWAGLAMMLGAGLWLKGALPYPGFYAVLPTLGAAFILAAGSHGSHAGVSRWLSVAPMQAIGRISYAWYLWHWPVLLLGHALTGMNSAAYRLVYVLVSLVLAVLSHHLVEAPMRRQSWWLKHQRSAVYGALFFTVVAAFGMLRWEGHAYQAALSPSQRPFTYAKVDAPPIDTMHCDEWSARLLLCAFGSEKAAHTAVLVGDSVAAQWFSAVAPLFTKPDWRLIVLTKSACPMVDEVYFYARIRRDYTECTAWRRSALKEISRLRPDIVVASSVAGYDFTREQWKDGSARILKQLSESAGRVYVLRSTPLLPFNGPDCLAEKANRPAWLPFGLQCSAAADDPHADLVYAAIKQAAASFPNVQPVDMTDAVCPGGVCEALEKGVIAFRDNGHLTATYVASLEPELARRLQSPQELARSAGGGETSGTSGTRTIVNKP